MEIINLTRKHPSIRHMKTSFILSFKYLKDIWLFNCCQGCQHIMEKRNLKISQISRIIITERSIENISGLLGLLSSLSLINRKKVLNIYATEGLEKYLTFGKKYSHTNFRYKLYFHILKTGLIISNDNYNIYTFFNNLKFEFLLISREKYGKFKLAKAQKFNLITGPLYRKLKNSYTFLLPDGIIINGNKFTNHNQAGTKISLIIHQYYTRNSIEISNKSKVLKHRFIA
nr:hypothetical protein [Cystoclonium purpureum f. stellatum]